MEKRLTRTTYFVTQSQLVELGMARDARVISASVVEGGVEIETVTGAAARADQPIKGGYSR